MHSTIVHHPVAARRQCCRRASLFSAAVLEPQRAGPEPCVPAAWLLRCSSAVVYYSSILYTTLYCIDRRVAARRQCRHRAPLLPSSDVEPRRAGTKPCASAVMAAARRQCCPRSSLLLSSGARAAARRCEAVRFPAAITAAARRQCGRRSPPLPSSGARATARWYGAVFDGGRCAARCGAVDRGVPAAVVAAAARPVAAVLALRRGLSPLWQRPLGRRFFAACAV